MTMTSFFRHFLRQLLPSRGLPGLWTVKNHLRLRRHLRGFQFSCRRPRTCRSPFPQQRATRLPRRSSKSGNRPADQQTKSARLLAMPTLEVIQICLLLELFVILLNSFLLLTLIKKSLIYVSLKTVHKNNVFRGSSDRYQFF